MSNKMRFNRLCQAIVCTITESKTRFVIVAHLTLIAFFFSPFLLRGMKLIASSDNKFHLVPNYFFSLRALVQGDLGLWNPYIACGINFTGSTHNYVYSPFNWILFLLPEQYFHLGLTVRIFIEMWLVGVFGFLAFTAALGSRKWAFFSSLNYQLCSLMFLGTTLYPALTTMLLATITTYLLFTMGQRKLYISFALLTLSIATMFLSGHIVYVAYIMLSVILLYAFFTLTHPAAIVCQAKYWGVFALAVMISASIGAVRLLPFAEALRDGTRLLDSIANLGFQDVIFLHYFAFIPETLGVNFASSEPVLAALGFKGHIHGAASFYMGAASISLVIWSLIAIRKNKPIKILTLMFLPIWLWLMNVQPIAGVFNIGFFPLLHPLGSLYLLPMGMCLMVGYIAKHIEEHPTSVSTEKILIFLLVCGLVLLGVVSVWLKVYPHILGNVRLAGVITLVLLFVSYLLFENALVRPPLKRLVAALILLSVAGIYYLILPQEVKNFLQEKGSSYVFRLGAMYLLTSLAFISTLLLTVLFFVMNSRFRNVSGIATAVALLVLLGVLIIPFTGFSKHPSMPESFLLVVMGSARFVLVSVLLVILLSSLKTRKLETKYFLLVLLLVSLGDLLPFNKIYSRIVTEPFFKRKSLYPALTTPGEILGAESKVALDLENYRVNHPHLVLGLSGNEIETNIPNYYGVRLYGGLNSQFSKKYTSFIRNFDYGDQALASSIAHTIEDPRFLDLVGARYDVGKAGEVSIRPNALSRFMLFTHFEAIENETAALARLKAVEFNPLTTIVLRDEPAIDSSEYPEKAVMVQTTHATPSRVELNIITKKPAVLFFGDSYDEGWRVFINGKQGTIIPANFQFMATTVGTGQSRIIFKFEPVTFTASVIVAKTAIGLFLLITLVLWIYPRIAEKYQLQNSVA